MGQESLWPENKEGESINAACYSMKEVKGGGDVEGEDIREGGRTEKK